MRQPTHVQYAGTDLCKTRPTRTVRHAWFVRTVKDGHSENSHARFVPPDNLALKTALADHAAATQFQHPPEARVAPVVNIQEWAPTPPATRGRLPATRCVSVPRITKAQSVSSAPVRHVPVMKFQTRTEPPVNPLRPALAYVRLHLKNFEAVNAFPAAVISILIRQTTHVRHVRMEKFKTPTTRTIRTARFVRAVRVESVQKQHARRAPPDNMPTQASVVHARALQCQALTGHCAFPATAADNQAVTEKDASASTEILAQ